MLTLFKSLVSFSFLSFLNFCSSAALESASVRIIQLIEHPALDQTREGLLDELRDQGVNDFSWESAQGTPLLSSQIVEKFLGQKPSVIVAIATLPAQIALKLAGPSQTPVVYTSVTDPEQAKLSGLITGVSNFIDVNTQLDFIQKIMPSLKKLGIIYNPGEINSESLLAATKKICQDRGLILVPAIAAKTSEVSSAMTSLVGKVDAVFINNDNTALAAFDSVIKISNSYKIPVFTSDIDLVPKGALAALGPDQYELGRQTGRMVARILKGEPVQSIAPELPADIDVKINSSQAKAMGINSAAGLLSSLSPLSKQALPLKTETIS